MNTLTAILVNNANYNIEETAKESNGVRFKSGKEQRVSRGSIPTIKVTIDYKGLNYTQFEAIKTEYENNFANTFKVDFNQTDWLTQSNFNLDIRETILDTFATTWAFEDFSFNATPNSPYEGTITLISSKFFNYPAYQLFATESSVYNIATTTDTSFSYITDYIYPSIVRFSYLNGSLYSSLFGSKHYQDDNSGLKLKVTYGFVGNLTNINRIVTFYRKKSGIMKEFGLPLIGYDESIIMNARFDNNDLQYTKRIDGLYQVELDFIEVFNG